MEKSTRLNYGVLDVSTILANTATVLSTIVSAQPGLKKIFDGYLNDLPQSKGDFFKPQDYVCRRALEAAIEDIYHTNYTDLHGGSYTIMVGVKGAGKSYTIAHVLREKPGVLLLPISQAETPSSIGRKLLLKCSQAIDNSVEVDVRVLLPLFEEVAVKVRPMTIVFEVERGTASEEVLYTVKKTAKQLAIVANVIIVLSEANAGLAFGDDDRQNFLWVDGMREEEAMACGKKFFPEINENELKAFIEKVSTEMSCIHSPCGLR